MNYQPDVFDLYSSAFEGRRQIELSLREYLTLCRTSRRRSPPRPSAWSPPSVSRT
jgi:hypothetical protein